MSEVRAISGSVFSVAGARTWNAVQRVVGTVSAGVLEACRPAPLAAASACDVFRTRAQLMVESAMLRQQLTVASRTLRQPPSWTAQQLRDATPFDSGPLFIIRDHDKKFGASFDRVAEGPDVCVAKTGIRAPLMNAVCERFVGSVRRECLAHVVIPHHGPTAPNIVARSVLGGIHHDHRWSV